MSSTAAMADRLPADAAWFANRVRAVQDTVVRMTPSEWGETNRYLPPGVTPFSGPFSFALTPYLREIVDCMDKDSPIREVYAMKGAQIGFTAGVMENALGYWMGHVRNAPMMYVTETDDLLKARLDLHIKPMLRQSGLGDLAQSQDERNKRKSGEVGTRMEWAGGFFLGAGAQSTAKLSSFPIRVGVLDEVDKWPLTLRGVGCPVANARARTFAYDEMAKILAGSTPAFSQTSKILPLYKSGDCRKYFVPCRRCGEMQFLEWTGRNEDGTAYGILYDAPEGKLVEGSVRYVCKFCQGEFHNDDKTWFLANGEWRPTQDPDGPHIRSYFLPSLYSPAGMRSWESVVYAWLAAWDVINNGVKDGEKLHAFYNNDRGVPYTMQGQRVKIAEVLPHQRQFYTAGTVPNEYAQRFGGGIVQLVTAAIDVHEKHIDYAAYGWSPGQRPWGLAWKVFEGDTDDINTGAWQALYEFLIGVKFVSDDKRLYYPEATLIDSQHKQDKVFDFCDRFDGGLVPISGRKNPIKDSLVKEYTRWKSEVDGRIGFHIATSIYKNRLNNMLRREWDGQSLQPEWHPNFPIDYPHEFFKQLCAEVRVQLQDKTTKKFQGYSWENPGNAANHTWDLTVYNMAALEILARHTCETELELEDGLDWDEFWAYCELKGPFHEMLPG